MITLFGFGPAFGLPAASPFAIKTDLQLKMSGLPYAYGEGGIPQNGPKGKIPWIEDDGLRLGDSTFIRDHLEKKYGVDLDAGLTREQRARAWCVERMLEDHLYWAMVQERWLDDANFAKGPATFFDRMPEGMRDTVRRETRERVKNTVYAQGLGRHSPAEIADLGARSIASLAVQIGDKPYLMGDKPCGADATAFAFAVSVLTPFFNGPLRDAACLYPNLLSYTGRTMQLYYPEIATKAA
ncbi:MAG: glutathione S-transferase family protein [Alphaproteobacteria bacterium]|nr:glutathione S-transferase family protein [Alphaproteobacteria bacterium]MDE2112147.1 glutathione S-transferase family protein [Alphaproteobacteria bacterium]MDE2495778.1 glutathione S-transferase family protein [Alphaproteobacteria bacterium]